MRHGCVTKLPSHLYLSSKVKGNQKKKTKSVNWNRVRKGDHPSHFANAKTPSDLLGRDVLSHSLRLVARHCYSRMDLPERVTSLDCAKAPSQVTGLERCLVCRARPGSSWVNSTRPVQIFQQWHSTRISDLGCGRWRTRRRMSEIGQEKEWAFFLLLSWEKANKVLVEYVCLLGKWEHRRASGKWMATCPFFPCCSQLLRVLALLGQLSILLTSEQPFLLFHFFQYIYLWKITLIYSPFLCDILHNCK